MVPSSDGRTRRITNNTPSSPPPQKYAPKNKTASLKINLDFENLVIDVQNSIALEYVGAYMPPKKNTQLK